MRNKIAAIIHLVNLSIATLIVFVTPLFFISLTTEFYETPKLIFLAVAVSIMLLLWSISWVLEGKVLVTRTPIDIPLLLFAVILLLSAYFSSNKYISFLGSIPKIHGSASTWILYILFYFVTVSSIKNLKQVKIILLALTASSTIVAALTLASYFGLYLQLPFTKAAEWTPTGSSFSTTALLVLSLPVLLISALHKDKVLPLHLSVVLATIFGIVIALTGSISTQVGALVAVLLTAFFTRTSFTRKNLGLFLVPLIVSLGILGLSYLNLSQNILNQKRLAFPREIQLPFDISWKISASSFRDFPFLGPGPSTYQFSYTIYKPAEVNTKSFWNLRFSNAFNEYLQTLGTTGLLGFTALVFLSLIIFMFAWKNLKESTNSLGTALSISALVSVLLLSLHTSSVVSIVAIFTVLALMMAVNKHIGGKVEELTFGIKARGKDELIVADILPYILFLSIACLVIAALWNLKPIVMADVFHRKALSIGNGKILDIHNNLVEAEKTNPKADLYRLDIAQTNFLIANGIVSQKGPTESSPGGSFTEQDKQNIQTFLAQAVNEARAATILSPKNVQNWEVLASIYRNISGVAKDSLTFSLDAYGRAIQLDPFNPLLRLNVGGVYYSIKNYDLAIRFFNDAINLKPDFANAYYNLSIALRDKGDMQSAQASAERVVALLQSNQNSVDYKVASEYLKDLKARIATGSADKSGITPPAASQKGPLQNQALPNVLDNLEAPGKTATPPAVKKNPKVSLPTPASSPTPSATPAP